MKGLILHHDPNVRKMMKEHFPEFVFAESMPQDEGPWDILIRWGNSDGADDARIVLNRRQSIENASSSAKMLGMLRLNGIKCQRGNSSSFRRRYRVYVFDLQVVALYRKRSGIYKRLPVDLNSEVIEKVKSAATRTAYILGLHIGMIEVGLINEWKTAVISITSGPKMSRALSEIYADSIRAHISKHGVFSDGILPLFKSDPILGADPEFMLRNRHTGRMVPASRLFPKLGPIGCDDRAVRGTIRTFPLAEVRPQPASNPIELVKNIRTCLKKAVTMSTSRELRSTRWEAGSMPFRGYPIGGHIHFSNINLCSDLLRALDNYLAIPTMLIERNATAVQRRRKYGHLGDHRVKNHGGFEYRTLGSWLMSPKIATAVICLAKLVATEYKNLSNNYLDTLDSQRAFYQCNKGYFQTVFPNLWRELESTSTYYLYADELTVLKELVDENKRWKETVDIKKAWNLV